MPIPQTVSDLIHRFDANQAAYRSAQYNEAQVREEFITPFFAALGWDVYNRQGASEKYKPVIHEASLKVAGSTKAPDYAFRIGGRRVFFVEAKKPAVALKDAPDPAYQLRRYAWSAKLPLSILTNFAEFAIYDCRDKPSPHDKASAHRIAYITYQEYPEQWDDLAGIFAPEAITQGAFDRYVESTRSKRGTAEVDVAFLAEIEGWRELLARNIALRNPGLSVRELNYAVQQTIDRIIFLRIAEDRGIEPYQRLLDATQSQGIYRRLGEVFRQADNRYNSGLFYFQPEPGREEDADTFTLDLSIDDKVLKTILHSLYYPTSPYQFDMLPADILGQVYEQFLGRVIRLTPTGRAKVEEKPEVKKAGGVYYTPTYIVDYIVAHTLDPLLEGKTPRQVKGSARVAPLRVLDPACGSGTFLIQAYQYLLDWYLEQYVAEDPRPVRFVHPDRSGWRLTTEERKAILLRHIYGVDIDPQAVGVTKLSLLLKVLEGETEATLGGTQMAMSVAGQDRVLPDLSRNIRCGNSLIGPDYYQGEQLSLGLVDEETLYRINAFDWEQGFHQAMMAGGFDAVIGNPPYVLLQDRFRDAAQLDYLQRAYTVAAYKVDTYHLFIEKGLCLLNTGGYFGMITPANFLTNNYAVKLRRFILENAAIQQILVNDDPVFAGISVDTAILVCQAGQKTDFVFPLIHVIRKHNGEETLQVVSQIEVSGADALRNGFALFTGSVSQELADVWRKIAEISTPLQAITHVNFGKQLRNRRRFTEDVIEIPTLEALPEGYRPCYTGRNVQRYALQWENLACRDDTVAQRGGCWNASRQDAANKLLTRQIGRYPEFALDALGYQCLNTVFMVNLKVEGYAPQFLLGILNSKLLQTFWISRFYDQRKTFPKIKGTYLKKLPIRTIDFTDPADVARHDRMVSLVEQMLALHRRQPEAKTPQATRLLQQQIDLTDQAIDALVYELYGLTEDEIAIIEGADDA